METVQLYRQAFRVRNDSQLRDFFDILTRHCCESTGARCAALFLADFALRRIRCRSVFFRDQGHDVPRKSFGYDEVIEGWVLDHAAEFSGRPYVVKDPEHDPRWVRRTESPVECLLIAPITDEMEGSGYIAAGTITLFDRPGGFDEASVEAAREAAAMAAIALFHAETSRALSSARISLKDALQRKSEEITELHRALQRRHEENLADLRLATRIHRSLLAASLAPIPGFRVASRFRPSHHLAGDYIDLFRADKDHYAVVIADVSGTGVSACLIAAFAREAFRRALSTSRSAEEALRDVASTVGPILPEQFFLTALAARVSIDGGEIEICAAGHPAPIRIGPGFAREENVLGDAIGFGGGYRFGTARLKLLRGERLLFYTDGVTEIANADQVPFGHKRLLDLLSSRSEQEVNSLADLILRASEIYAGASDDVDDRALIILEKV